MASIASTFIIHVGVVDILFEDKSDLQLGNMLHTSEKFIVDFGTVVVKNAPKSITNVKCMFVLVHFFGRETKHRNIMV